jgi:hypothetical protein
VAPRIDSTPASSDCAAPSYHSVRLHTASPTSVKATYAGAGWRIRYERASDGYDYAWHNGPLWLPISQAASRTYNVYSERVSTPAPKPGAAKNLGAMIFVTEASFDQDLAAAKQAGFSWVRLDIPQGSYGTLNRSTGVFTRSAARSAFYRQALQKAKNAGVKVVLDMAALDNDPSWSDATYNAYNANVLRAVSQDIGANVALWQIFNEHDGNNYRTQAGQSMTTAYLTRLRNSLAAMRTALRTHSAAPVTTTTFGYPINQARYDRWQAFWDVVNPAADVIGLHAYPEKNQATIDLVPLYMRRLKARYHKPVAVLEFGVPNVRGYGTEAQVGDAIVRQIAAIMSADPFCATLYQLRDRGKNPNDTNGENVFGLVQNNWVGKSYRTAVTTEVKKYR